MGLIVLASGRSATIIAISIFLLILPGILLTLALHYRDENKDGGHGQLIENSLLDGHAGTPVIVHLLFLENAMDHDEPSVYIQQIFELSMIGSQADDIDIITICRINDSDLQSGKAYLEEVSGMEISWSWFDDPDIDSIPDMCQNGYDDLTGHGDQTLIFLDRNHTIFSIFRLSIAGNGTNTSVLSYQEMISRIRSINGEASIDDWLEDYTPSFGVGQQENDWWATYPTQNPLSGSTPIHPKWLVDMLKNGSILILLHSTACMPCIIQQESVEMMESSYGERIQIVDLQFGMDDRPDDIIKRYDPNGSPNFIPSTILLTIMETVDSYLQIVWHSAEGATGDDWLTGYVRDAIFYHDIYIEEWSL